MTLPRLSPDTGPPDTQLSSAEANALQLAFRAFTEISGELTESYQALEDRVSSLTRELEMVNAERLQELADKERIARRLQKLLQLLPGGVLVLNGQGRVVECNAAALDLLGEPLHGLAWVDVIRERFAPRRDDGHEISLVSGRRVSLLSRSLEEEPGQIILITDQTETRRLQQHLGRHQRLLEMGKMVSSLAHQIRTPLSAAMLYAGHLETMQTDPALQSRFPVTHERLMSRLHNMERQVKDMLLFARGEAILDETICLHQLLEETRMAAEVMLYRQPQACRWEVLVSERALLCNKESLIGAMLNLVDNALQNGGNAVRISVLADADCEPGFVRLFVQDDGPGIDPAILDQVTDAFYTTRAQGTGLGLAVAKVVARAHGGRFFIENAALTVDAPALSTPAATGVRAGFILPFQPIQQQEVRHE